MSEEAACTVYIVDDGSVFCYGLSAALSESKFINVVGTAGDSSRTIELIRNIRPHVVITVLHHQGMIELIKHVRGLSEGAVAVLAIGEPGPLVVEALLVGACGMLSWRATVEQIADAALAAGRGTRQLCSDVAGQVTFSIRAATRKTAKLSNREIEVLLRAADGQTNTRIARALSLSEATVKTYWQRVFKKLNVHDRTTAVTTAMGMGIVTGCACPPSDEAKQWEQAHALRACS